MPRQYGISIKIQLQATVNYYQQQSNLNSLSVRVSAKITKFMPHQYGISTKKLVASYSKLLLVAIYCSQNAKLKIIFYSSSLSFYLKKKITHFVILFLFSSPYLSHFVILFLHYIDSLLHFYLISISLLWMVKYPYLEFLDILYFLLVLSSYF